MQYLTTRTGDKVHLDPYCSRIRGTNNTYAISDAKAAKMEKCAKCVTEKTIEILSR